MALWATWLCAGCSSSGTGGAAAPRTAEAAKVRGVAATPRSTGSPSAAPLRATCPTDRPRLCGDDCCSDGTSCGGDGGCHTPAGVPVCPANAPLRCGAWCCPASARCDGDGGCAAQAGADFCSELAPVRVQCEGPAVCANGVCPAADSSASANHASVSLPAEATGGRFAGGLALNQPPYDPADCAGRDVRASAPTAGFPVANEPVTIQAWLRTRSTVAQLVFGYGAHPNERALYFVGNELRWPLPDGSCAATPVNLADGCWHFVSVTWDNGNAAIFVDGVLARRCTGLPALATPGGSRFAFGNRAGTPPLACVPFQGDLDEVRVSSFAASDSQIASDFTSGPLTAVTGTVGLWHFDDEGQPIDGGAPAWRVDGCCPAGTTCGLGGCAPADGGAGCGGGGTGGGVVPTEPACPSGVRCGTGGRRCCAVGEICRPPVPPSPEGSCGSPTPAPFGCPTSLPTVCPGNDGPAACCPAGATCVAGPPPSCALPGPHPRRGGPAGPPCHGTPGADAGAIEPDAGLPTFCDERSVCAAPETCCPADAPVACGAACCPPDAPCVGGACGCPAGQEACGGSCCVVGARCVNGRQCELPCSDPDFPTACGSWCCAKGATCSGSACGCPDSHPVACDSECCLPGASCVSSGEADVLACACPSGRAPCGDDTCCPLGQVCGAGRCVPAPAGGGDCPGGLFASTAVCLPGAPGGSCDCLGDARGRCITAAEFQRIGAPVPTACVGSGQVGPTGSCTTSGRLANPCCPGLTCRNTLCGGNGANRCLP
jgi:hypothetical protein